MLEKENCYKQHLRDMAAIQKMEKDKQNLVHNFMQEIKELIKKDAQGRGARRGSSHSYQDLEKIEG